MINKEDNSGDASFSNPPNVNRTVGVVSEAASGDSSLSPRSKGKLEEIIESYRSVTFTSATSTKQDNSSAATTSSATASGVAVAKMSYDEDLKNFNESNLEFLYETFPDLKKEYCRRWLRRYNGDLVKTCDYLTRVSQVELPQNEEDDVEDHSEEIEMIDLTQEDEDDVDFDISEKIYQHDGDMLTEGEGASASGVDVGRSSGRPVGEIFLQDEGTSSGGRSRDEVRVAIDKSFAMEMKKRFGKDDDFKDSTFLKILLIHISSSSLLLHHKV